MGELLYFMWDTLVLVVSLLTSLVISLYHLLVPPVQKDLSGEVAVVTGAGMGIGREIATQLAGLGVKVACWDVKEKEAREISEKINSDGGEAIDVTVDITDKEAVKEASHQTISKLGHVTILVNNAGIMPCKPFLSFTDQELEKQFSVNVLSHFWTIRQFLPRMLQKNHGHIVAMSSVAGLNGAPNLTPYCSTKFAVRGLMDSLFHELRTANTNNNIKLTTVMPYVVTTGLAKNPSSRFMSILPYTSPQDAARLTIQAMRSDQEQAFIPTFLRMSYNCFTILPRAGQLAILDYLKPRVETD